MSIQESLSVIEDLFSIFDDPKDKFSQLMDIAKESEGIPISERTEEARVYGCASQAWVVGEKSMNNYVFRCDSDALIVKGLLSLLCKIFSGHGSKEIQSIDHSKILDLIGLSGAISVQRTNGFASAVDKIHKISV
ncbi:MAG: SufE family protein [Candidatus Marinimicrobia bacterium]|jgi:cysteine desulfuration protein SufE|nr:SufE family protein [Candidatus Neomarinimicrobiota bacterium]MEE3152675.1 SufE family protein [Candidatus Neomarinimicrobiota bacterium]|tara:strand:- start:337 stop:741 length:405 start_codon:yes stop_codon:yes gene_type:complete